MRAVTLHVCTRSVGGLHSPMGKLAHANAELDNVRTYAARAQMSSYYRAAVCSLHYLGPFPWLDLGDGIAMHLCHHPRAENEGFG